ncbi:MAG: hypothetical protein ACLFSW_04395 [Halobacteriales archaeon]
MRRRQHSYLSQSTVIGVSLLVGLTVLIAGVVVVTVSSIEPPSDVDDALPTRSSPFEAENVGGSFTGGADELSMYDSSTGEFLDDSPNRTDGSTPPSVDEGVGSTASSLEGSSSLPDSTEDGEIHVGSGGYYVNTSNSIRSSWDDERVVFDTSDGPVRIALDGDGFLDSGRILAEGTEFAVKGSHPVEVYVERSTFSADLTLVGVEFDGKDTGAFRVYAESNDGWEKSEISIRGGSEFRGIVYAPGSEVEVKNSEFYGASVADETDVEGSSYYHDSALKRLGEDALP